MPHEDGSSRMKAVVGGLLAAGVILTGGLAMAAKAPKGGDYGYGRAYGHRLHCPSYTGMYHSKGRAMCHTAPRRGGVNGAEVPPPVPTTAGAGAERGGAQPTNAGSAASANKARAAATAPVPAPGLAKAPRPEGRAEQLPPAAEARDERVDDKKRDQLPGHRDQRPADGPGQGDERRRQRP